MRCGLARSRTPWLVVTAAVLSVLVAAGALAAAAAVREHRQNGAGTTTTAPPSETSGVDADGCRVEPCAVLATAPIGDTTVELVADRDRTSGRLRIGGVASSKVIEVTITDTVGVVLTADSLQCVADSLSACLVRGQFGGGTAGQVVVGRSGKWNELARPFVSDAGYLALADLRPDVGPEIVAVQHDCVRTTTADCTGTPVFAEVYSMTSAVLGCTRDYARIEALPGFPAVDLDDVPLQPCA